MTEEYHKTVLCISTIKNGQANQKIKYC